MGSIWNTMCYRILACPSRQEASGLFTRVYLDYDSIKFARATEMPFNIP